MGRKMAFSSSPLDRRQGPGMLTLKYRTVDSLIDGKDGS
jgi:hypothetical protein